MNRVEYISGIVEEKGWTKGAEVGVYKGWFFFGLLKTCPNLFMTGVDSWIVLSGEGDKKSTGFAPYAEMDIEEQGRIVRARCEDEFPGRARIIHMPSLQAAEQVKDDNLDFVQIDADHRTSFVRADLAAWYPKVTVGGIIFGHDWNTFHSVRRAVSGFEDLTVDEEANIWSIPRKKGLWPC